MLKLKTIMKLIASLCTFSSFTTTTVVPFLGRSREEASRTSKTRPSAIMLHEIVTGVLAIAIRPVSRMTHQDPQHRCRIRNEVGFQSGGVVKGAGTVQGCGGLYQDLRHPSEGRESLFSQIIGKMNKFHDFYDK